MPAMTSTRFSIRLAGAVAAFLAAGAVSAAGAQATTFCVLAPGCTGTPVDGLQEALDLAAGAAGDDRVELGRGTFTSPKGFSYLGAATEGALELVGSGPGTVVAADAPSKAGDFAALTLQGGDKAAVHVRGMRIATPARADAQARTQGIALERATGEALEIGQEPGPFGAEAPVVLRAGATLRSSTVSARNTPQTVAVWVAGGGARLEDSEVSGGVTGILVKTNGTVQVTRTLVDATGGGTAAVRCRGCGDLELYSSVLRVAATAAGVRAEGLWYAPAKVDASHLTIVGTGSDATVGVEAVAGSDTGAIATLRVDDCIVDRVSRALVATSPLAGGNPAAVTAVRCNHDPSGNLTTGPATLVQEERTTLDPRFVDAAAGDLRLAHDSPLIDLGRGEGRFVDAGAALGGLPRDVDGDWVPGPKPDLGAHEYQASVPVARIGGALSVPAGVPVALDGAGSTDADPGEQLTYTWVLPGTERATGPVLTRTFEPGQTPVTLNVTDPTGRRGTTTVIVEASWTGAEPVLLSAVRVAPRAVRRGRAAQLRLALARPALVVARLQRRAHGRWRRSGRLVHRLPAGDGAVPFVPGMTAKLPRGRYRALVEARGNHEVARAEARFRVVARRR